MKRLLGLLIITLLHIGHYGGQTEGLYVEVGNVSYGFEYKGDIGFFKCYTIEGQIYC